jgi:hypothetical protein
MLVPFNGVQDFDVRAELAQHGAARNAVPFAHRRSTRPPGRRSSSAGQRAMYSRSRVRPEAAPPPAVGAVRHPGSEFAQFVLDVALDVVGQLAAVDREQRCRCRRMRCTAVISAAGASRGASLGHRRRRQHAGEQHVNPAHNPATARLPASGRNGVSCPPRTVAVEHPRSAADTVTSRRQLAVRGPPMPSVPNAGSD